MDLTIKRSESPESRNNFAAEPMRPFTFQCLSPADFARQWTEQNLVENGAEESSYHDSDLSPETEENKSDIEEDGEGSTCTEITDIDESPGPSPRPVYGNVPSTVRDVHDSQIELTSLLSQLRDVRRHLEQRLPAERYFISLEERIAKAEKMALKALVESSKMRSDVLLRCSDSVRH
ncbi:hypothetical protein AAF712_010623 [Marasmius tenuissimus]|uniref:Uncharacterized protein n=1 Tax=Marasmius tenuissimus TaxID=585030 RepID=A0ABR2ZLD3_9AGAR